MLLVLLVPLLPALPAVPALPAALHASTAVQQRAALPRIRVVPPGQVQLPGAGLPIALEQVGARRHLAALRLVSEVQQPQPKPLGAALQQAYPPVPQQPEHANFQQRAARRVEEGGRLVQLGQLAPLAALLAAVGIPQLRWLPVDAELLRSCQHAAKEIVAVGLA